MPRNGQGVYSLPPVYEAVTGETIEAQQHNVPLEDLAADANNARPISTGGTGGQSATQARENLDVYSKTESVQAAKDAIGELGAKETPVDADSVVIVDSEDENKPKKTLWSKIKLLINTGSVGAAIAAANGKETPADGDFFTGVEAGGSTMFKTTWSQIKTLVIASAQALFDLRYLKLGGGTLTGGLIVKGDAYISTDSAAGPTRLFMTSPSTERLALFSNSDGGNITLRLNNTHSYIYRYDGAFIAPARVYAGGETGANMVENGDIWGTRWGAGGGYISNYIDNGLAAKPGPQRCGWDTGVVELGSIDVSFQNLTIDAPAPYVLVGIRSASGTSRVWARAAILKNNGG